MEQIMVLSLLLILAAFAAYKKYPEIRKKLRERKLEEEYFRRIRR